MVIHAYLHEYVAINVVEWHFNYFVAFQRLRRNGPLPAGKSVIVFSLQSTVTTYLSNTAPPTRPSSPSPILLSIDSTGMLLNTCRTDREALGTVQL